MKEVVLSGPFESPWAGVETAGSAALSFANTLDWRLRPKPVELLRDYEDLLRWARTEGGLAPAEARALQRSAVSHPRVATRTLRKGQALREAMAELWTAAASRGTLPPGALDVVGNLAAEARARQTLRAVGSRVAWQWRAPEPELERPIWFAALAASRLLITPELGRVRQCGDAECGWFFLDTTKNRSRRWCSMEACGNRNKARRFYRRSRA